MSAISAVLRRLPWRKFITEWTPVIVHAGKELYTNIKKVTIRRKPARPPIPEDTTATSLIDMRIRLDNLEAGQQQHAEELQRLVGSLNSIGGELKQVANRLTAILLVGLGVLFVTIVILVKSFVR